MRPSQKRYVCYQDDSAEFTIWNLSDLHLMSKACAEDRIAADVQRIKDDPYAYWIGGGDYADLIGHTDRRFALRTILRPPANRSSSMPMVRSPWR